MLRPTIRTTPSNRNSVLRSMMHGTSHLFYPLQGLRGRMGQDDGDGLDIYAQAGVDPTYTMTMQQSTGTGSTEPLLTSGAYLMTGPNPSAGELAAAGYPLSTPVATGPSPTTGTQSPSPTTLAAALAADATQIAAPIVKAATQQAPYYVTNPATGQSVLYNPNTGQTVGATSIGKALASLSPTTIVIGIVLIGAVALMSGKK
jgi:hypothetical protein